MAKYQTQVKPITSVVQKHSYTDLDYVPIYQ